MQKEIQEAAYRFQQSIEDKERILVGVNDFQTEEADSIPIHTIDPQLEPNQVASLQRARAARDGRAVSEALARLETAARGTDNLMPHILAAVEAYASVGEISDTFRKVHGEYREALTI